MEDPFTLYKEEVMEILGIDSLSGNESSIVFACFKNSFTASSAAEELESSWFADIEEDYNSFGYYD